jgi:hypothetical protein
MPAIVPITSSCCSLGCLGKYIPSLFLVILKLRAGGILERVSRAKSKLEYKSQTGAIVENQLHERISVIRCSEAQIIPC